jgi:hypothetical protein
VLEFDDLPDLPVDLDMGAVLELIRADRHWRRGYRPAEARAIQA